MIPVLLISCLVAGIGGAILAYRHLSHEAKPQEPASNLYNRGNDPV